MKILKHFILPLAIACTFVACGSDNNDDNGNSNGGNQIGQVSKNENANDPAINRFDTRLEFPHLKGGKSLLLVHTTKDSYDKDGVNLSIEWDASKKAQRWTCYQMHKGFGGTAGRYPDFEEDPDLPAEVPASLVVTFVRLPTDNIRGMPTTKPSTIATFSHNITVLMLVTAIQEHG